MRFGSVCSGIEAASVAWHPLGWRAAWLAEIDKFPSAVLAHHYPDVPNLGDMRNLVRMILRGEIEAPDVFAGGTPCQAFSVAGKRESLSDARGNLSLTFCEIANAIDHVRVARGEQPCIIKWENVPGVLSTRDNAFGCFLGALAGAGCELQPAGGRWSDAGCVYGPERTVAWRVLDAQYFGLAQRRRRVFVVASARNGFDPAAVLFESDGVRRDSAPRREAGKDTSGSTGDGVARCLTTGEAKRQDWETCKMIAHSLRGEGFDASEDGTGRGTPLVPVAFGIRSDAIREGVAKTPSADAEGCVRLRNPGMGVYEEIAPTIDASQPHIAAQSMAVRRLTPRECERLQGFPTVTENVTVDVCIDLQSGSASVALSCRRWQNSASRADGSGLEPLAEIATSNSVMRQAGRVPLAALHVLNSYAPEAQAIHSRGRLIWSATGADQSGACLQSTQHGDIAREAARLTHELANEIRDGRAGSPVSIRLSLPAGNGSESVTTSGDGMVGNAAAVESAPNADTFTTSDLGQLLPASGSITETLCCSALAAIAGCIPSETLPETFSVELSVESPYTLIPWRGKPAEHCPDGPRYKALGNSWAVPVARWVGERIARALA